MVNLLHTLLEAIVIQSMISRHDRKAHYCTECVRNKEFVYFLVMLDARLVFTLQHEILLNQVLLLITLRSSFNCF